MYVCEVEGCPFKAYTPRAIRCHVFTIHPNGTFCPICLKLRQNKGSLIIHLEEVKVKCADDPSAVYYGITRKGNGKVATCDGRFYNRYFLGTMEKYDCPDLAFYYLASRKRRELLDINIL